MQKSKVSEHSSAIEICSQHTSITPCDFFPSVCTNKSQRLGVLHFTSYAFVGVTNVHKEQLVT